MNKIVAGVVFTAVLAVVGWQTQAQAKTLPPELGAVLPAASLSGQATMSVWGFDVYSATLWVATGFDQAVYDQGTFALELAYLRDFKGADIARRSLSEMRRQRSISAVDESRWEDQMRAVFPDVKAGDRITGIHQPGVGVVFLGNGRSLGEIRDPAFAKLFFGIWLSPKTSEPKLRQALLVNAASSPSGKAATP